MEIVAHIENAYKEKFGVPRQSGIVDEVLSRIVFEERFRNPDAVRGLHQFSHLWLIWIFSEGFASGKDAGIFAPVTDPECSSEPPNLAGTETGHTDWSPTVRPPRLGGNERIGVWASRSPNRPNPIGLSCVEIVDVEPQTPDGPVITVRGADLTDGTPILDIKPYIVYADSRPDASSGYATEPPKPTLTVTGLDKLPPDIDPAAVEAILALDPRPAYRSQKKDDTRVYHLRFGNYDIDFRATDDRLIITQARKTE